jgi:hypothetical protein
VPTDDRAEGVHGDTSSDFVLDRLGPAGTSLTLGTTSTGMLAASALNVPDSESSMAMIFSAGMFSNSAGWA